jgi:hypothetical protein
LSTEGCSDQFPGVFKIGHSVSLLCGADFLFWSICM